MFLKKIARETCKAFRIHSSIHVPLDGSYAIAVSIITHFHKVVHRLITMCHAYGHDSWPFKHRSFLLAFVISIVSLAIL